MAPARFLTDDSLDGLARRLRFLGFDVATLRGARLEDLFEGARHEGRIVLTMSSRHPRRFADVASLRVPREDDAAAVRGIADEYQPSGAPFSRCPVCNHALQRRTAFEARGEVPARAAQGAQFLHHCPNCGKWYWEGSHTSRMREWLERALGRPLPPSGSAAVRE